MNLSLILKEGNILNVFEARTTVRTESWDQDRKNQLLLLCFQVHLSTSSKDLLKPSMFFIHLVLIQILIPLMTWIIPSLDYKSDLTEIHATLLFIMRRLYYVTLHMSYKSCDYLIPGYKWSLGLRFYVSISLYCRLAYIIFNIIFPSFDSPILKYYLSLK